MALTVQTNNAAITALKHLNANTMNMNKSLERLSSGFRINNAADDAAGFAISSKLDAQTNRLKAASLNASQAQAMVKMADAGINEIQNMVGRIQVLATQASSANNAGELTKLNAERVKLESAIDKIASSSNYNGVNLLDGTGAGAGSFSSTYTQGTVNTGVTNAVVTAASTTNLNATYQLNTATSGNVTITDGSGGATDFVVSFQANSTSHVALDDGSKLDISFGAAPSGVATTTASTSGKAAVAGQDAYSTTGAVALGSTGNAIGIVATKVTSNGKSEQYNLNFVNATGIVTVTDKASGNTVGVSAGFTSGTGSNQTIKLSDGDSIKLTYDATAFNGTGKTDGLVGTLTIGSNSNGSLSFQVGADNTSANQIDVNLSANYSASSLGLGTGDLTTQTNAQSYLDLAKTAMNTLISNRADLGATTNQIGFIQANLATSIEQGVASVSSIRDADMAQEMANFTKNQILTQASTAMLAQANQAAQNVLTLFR
ncbi:MAG: flagellin [Mariprofundaceae bacterium]